MGGGNSIRVVGWHRFPLLALAIVSLRFGVWAGLDRFGWSLPQGRPNLIELHGPLMVFGFLGTVISLELAVALRRVWGYLAPAGTVAGTALLLALVATIATAAHARLRVRSCTPASRPAEAIR